MENKGHSALRQRKVAAGGRATLTAVPMEYTPGGAGASGRQRARRRSVEWCEASGAAPGQVAAAVTAWSGQAALSADRSRGGRGRRIVGTGDRHTR